MFKTAMARISRIPAQALIGVIRGYHYWISPLLGSRCRFYPSCSQYAAEAILRFGLLKGGFLLIQRMMKCHPWHEGGIDCIPSKEEQA